MSHCTHRRWEERGTMGRCLDCGVLFAPELYRLPPPAVVPPETPEARRAE